MTRESHSLRSACCDGSWQNRQQGERKQKSNKNTTTKQRQKGSPRRSQVSTVCPKEVLLPHLCPTWLLSLSGYSYQYQRHTQRATGPVATSLPHTAPVPPSGHSSEYIDLLSGPAAACKANREGMGSSHVSGSNDRKERRPAVIMAWGHRPWFSQTSKRERPCSCMLPSFLAEQATRRMEAPQAKRERQPLGRVEPPQSASQGLWLQKAAPHPAGNRSCCHISAPHGFCPPVWLQLSVS